MSVEISDRQGVLERKILREQLARKASEELLAQKLHVLHHSRLLNEEQIARSGALLRGIDEASDGIALVDESGEFTYMNRSHLTMFGYESASEVLGRPWTILYQPRELEEIRSRVFPVLIASGVWRGDMVGVGREGQPVHQEVTLTMLDKQIVCVTRDVTVRRRIEREHARLSDLVRDIESRRNAALLVDQIAHDLANMLTAIRFNAELIDHECDSAGIIVKATERAQSMVRQLHSRSQVSNGASASVDLCSIVGEVISLSSPMMQSAASVSLEIEPGLGAAKVVVDKHLLHRTILNILKNASEATQPGGSITIGVGRSPPTIHAGSAGIIAYGDRPAEAGIWLWIADTGIGISGKHLRELEAPAFSTKVSEDGAPRGLGFLSALALVRMHNLYCEVISAPDEGTMVSLQFPTIPSS